MNEPTYEQLLLLLAAYLNHQFIDDKLKRDILDAFCKKFNKDKETVLKDINEALN